MNSGDQSVTTTGEMMMPMWPADSLDSLDSVSRPVEFSSMQPTDNAHADAVARGMAFYGQSTGAIALDSLGCAGTEARLIDCSYQPGTSCTHAQDAGVDCSTTCECSNSNTIIMQIIYIFMLYVDVCEEGDVRLAGGSVNSEGRVEICIDETWSTICDNGWSLNDANVVCQQLGHLSTGKLKD